MTGVIEGLKLSLSGMFFIKGDDGITYFSHRCHAQDKHNQKKYLYNGNRATFDIQDDGKEHLTAVNVWFDEVEDPRAEEKRQIRIEDERRRAENERKREENYVKRLEEQVRYYRNKEFESKYIRYIVQTHSNGEWIPYKPNGRMILFPDGYTAIDWIRDNKQSGVQLRAKRAKVVKTDKGVIVRPL